MKKLLSLALASAMVLSLAACGGGNPGGSTPGNPTGSGSAAGDKVVKIGVFEPQSGDNGSGGKQEILGMQYANQKTPTVEIGGETYTVELVYADNQSSNDKAPSAAQTLVAGGVSIVLGSYGSGVSMAASDTFKEAGIAAMGVTCTNPNVTAGNDHYFRICFLDNFQAQVLANFAQDKFQAKTAYCLGETGNEYDQGLIAFFEQVFTANGGKVIKDSFPNNNSDFNSYLNKAKAEGADVIFTPVSIAYATQIITQAQSLGITAPFLGSDTLDDNMVLDAANGTDIQLYVSTFYQEGGAPDFDAGIKEYINSNSSAKDANGGNDTIAAVTAMVYDGSKTVTALGFQFAPVGSLPDVDTDAKPERPSKPGDDVDPDTCKHNWEETKRTDATCTLPGTVTSTCTKCEKTKTETLPKVGHTWEVKQTTQTSYDENGNVLTQGFTIYRCSVCGEEYKDTDGTGPPASPSTPSDPDDPGEEDGWLAKLLQKLGDFLGSTVGALLKLLGSILDGILDGLISLVTGVLDRLSQLVDLFGSFGEALGVLWTWLPTEVMTVLVAGVTIFVLLALLRLFLK